MWLIICWILGLRTLIYHLLFVVILITVIVCYECFKSSSTVHHNQRILLANQRGQIKRLGNQMKVVIMRRLGEFCDTDARVGHAARNHPDTRSQYRAQQAAAAHLSLAHLGAVCLVLAICQWPSPSVCLEQDAQILTPVASIAKSIIKTVTLGVPLEINVEPSGMVKSIAQFIWRTGFPVSMPKGFIQNAQNFYNDVRKRVNETQVNAVERKSLESLKSDLDNIVDAIVEQVRQSPDGLYTDYLQTRVGNETLEEACYKVGIQLKAYGVDLINYRDIAAAVLGVPVLPTLASAVINVASLGQSSLSSVQNLTSSAVANSLNLSSGLLMPQMQPVANFAQSQLLSMVFNSNNNGNSLLNQVLKT